MAVREFWIHQSIFNTRSCAESCSYSLLRLDKMASGLMHTCTFSGTRANIAAHEYFRGQPLRLPTASVPVVLHNRYLRAVEVVLQRSPGNWSSCSSLWLPSQFRGVVSVGDLLMHCELINSIGLLWQVTALILECRDRNLATVLRIATCKQRLRPQVKSACEKKLK